MIPILFPADYTHGNTTFSGHGIGDLIEATKVEAEENSSEGHEWELSFEYPETGELFSQLLLNRIVVAKVNEYQDKQAFRIYSISKNINRTVTVNCQHISYDLQNVPVKPFSERGANDCLVTLKQNMVDDTSVQSQTTYGKQFTFSTDIPDPTNKLNPGSEAERVEITVEFEEPNNARAVLFDGDNSVYGRFGGDVVINNYDISFKKIGGQNRGVSIDYGVDLVDFEQEKNISEMITGILPYYVKEKDIRISLKTAKSDEVIDATTNTHSIIVLALDEALTLEAGWKYTLTFVAEKSGGQGSINSNLGIGSYSFDMDGKSKKHEFTLDSSVTIAADAILFYGIPNQSGVNQGLIGTITNIELSKSPVEPIIYGDIVTRNDSGYEYEIPKYEVPKILPVNITDYFEDPNTEPAQADVTSKGQEYVNKEEVGIPEVSLTVSYANLGDKEVHLYDAVQVRFVKMGVTVSSKVTRYKYDVLNERIIEIDVGKTKDSAIFTLQDASRLKHGLLKPDRLAKESVTSDKLAKNSVGASQLDSASLSGGGWTMPADCLDVDALRGKVGTEALKTGGWHDDPVLISVPNNVYGGYSRNVGYLFDPSLGVPPEGLFGWTETDGQGQKHFHSVSEFKDSIPVSGGGSGVGYVLDTDFIFYKSIDASEKLEDESITAEKIQPGDIERAITLHNEAKLKAWMNLYDGVGPEAVTIGSDTYMRVPFLSTTRQLYIEVGDIAFPGPLSYGAYHFSPHKLYVDGTEEGIILSQSDIYINTSSGS